MTELTANAPLTRPASPWSDGWARWRKNKLAVGSLAMLFLVMGICLMGPFFLPESQYSATNLVLGATPPSFDHWMGTDVLGRDLMARVMQGGRISFAVGLLATLRSASSESTSHGSKALMA